MPIVDIRPVVGRRDQVPAGITKAVADAIGRVLHAAPGRVWVRYAEISDQHYAENGAEIETADLPVFVTVLHSVGPEGSARAEEARALTQAVATCFGRPVERVHLEYAPPGRGRVAFGGKLVE